MVSLAFEYFKELEYMWKSQNFTTFTSKFVVRISNNCILCFYKCFGCGFSSKFQWKKNFLENRSLLQIPVDEYQTFEIYWHCRSILFLWELFSCQKNHSWNNWLISDHFTWSWNPHLVRYGARFVSTPTIIMNGFQFLLLRKISQKSFSEQI